MCVFLCVLLPYRPIFFNLELHLILCKAVAIGKQKQAIRSILHWYNDNDKDDAV